MSERLFALEREASQRGYRLLVGHAHGQVEPLAAYVRDFGSWGGAEAILCLFDLAPGQDERTQTCFGKFQRRRLRIPGEIAVIGYDNLDIASVVSPSLTTVDQAHDEYARAAIGLLLDLAASRRIPRDRRVLTIAPRLVVREST